MKTPFIDVDFAQQSKHGQGAAGDVFVSSRLADEGRIVCVLADGLGSGIKANVLATLTATMAMKYVCSEMDIRKAADVIMTTLPVCSQRKIGYSTFTILDIHSDGLIRVVEYDNPPYVLLAGVQRRVVEKLRFDIETPSLGRRWLSYSTFRADKGSRLVVYSDGISQSGMGSQCMPLGWTNDSAVGFLTEQIRRFPDISARRLSREMVSRALGHDGYCAKDDISCAVVNFRDPRRLLVLTGPPIDRAKDKLLTAEFEAFSGKKVICGGTTANIVARELGRVVTMDLSRFDRQVPPMSRLEGVDLVTEGTLTMSCAAELLEQGQDPDGMGDNAAVRLVRYFLESDIIHFISGTKINEAHQDPNLPVELDIRRNLIRHIVRILNEKYMKQADCEFV